MQDQLKRASISVVLNIAEGVGRFTKADKSHFYIISRGSAFEVIAVLQIIANQYSVDPNVLCHLRADFKEVVKMLFGLIKNVSPKPIL
ncbi:four helix bundle protein [Candidatus Peregrinibacteria bacterium]|nr:four helix bundle protein [Candidatus Peregrinibacteria bacterium]